MIDEVDAVRILQRVPRWSYRRCPCRKPHPQGTSSNSVLLTLANGALTGWVAGFIAVTTAAPAMVPAATMCMRMSTLVTNNLFRPRT